MTLRWGPTPTRPEFEISALDAGEGLGRIGLCACPGRAYADLLAHSMVRNIDADLQAIRNFGASALLTLMERGELDWAGVPLDNLSQRVSALGMRPLYLPIEDGLAPDQSWEQSWRAHAPFLLQCLREGQSLVLHCRGGRGRAGLVAARLLMGFGLSAPDAIIEVRLARPGAIETRAQEDYLLSLGRDSSLRLE